MKLTPWKINPEFYKNVQKLLACGEERRKGQVTCFLNRVEVKDKCFQGRERNCISAYIRQIVDCELFLLATVDE